jgi:hypothetical protein
LPGAGTKRQPARRPREGRQGQLSDPEERGNPNTGAALEAALTALDAALAAMEGLMNDPVPSTARPALLATVPAALAAVAALVEDAQDGVEPWVREALAAGQAAYAALLRLSLTRG